eukprot:c642_g1_i1 orf=247-423(+)
MYNGVHHRFLTSKGLKVRQSVVIVLMAKIGIDSITNGYLPLFQKTSWLEEVLLMVDDK